MSFGFGIGDFIKVIEIAKDIRSRFVAAPEEFKAISNEIKTLDSVLRDIESVLAQRDLTDQHKARLEALVGDCKGILKEVEDLLDKYQELKPNIHGFGGRSRRVWKRLRWDQHAIDGLRSRIASNVFFLNTFLVSISSETIFATSETTSATKVGVDQLVNAQYVQERQAILDWLTPIDYATQQSDFISRRQASTGEWLLKSDQFRTWVNHSNQTLFCPGIPGAGKTMGAAIVINELLSKFRNDTSVNVSYLYCNFRRQHEQKPIDLLSSLLKQMVQRLPSVPQSVKKLHRQCSHDRVRPLIWELSQALESVIRDYTKTFVIVDALDECQVSDGARQQLLSELLTLQVETSTNLFITSRFIPEIVRALEGRSTQLEIRASNEDLQNYLNGHMPKLPLFVSRNPALQEDIRTTIIRAADGMFLLAQLHLDSLVGQPSPKAIRNALKTLPTGPEGYDRAYQEAMERIKGQVVASYTLAKRVLSWITCGKRPLTTLELRHALAVETNRSELDPENLPEIEDIVSVCAGLVTVDEESNIIRLVHYTMQEFFERTQFEWFPKAETEMASVCMTYLSFDVFDSGCSHSITELDRRLKSNPLYEYAAVCWARHFCNSNDGCINMKFLRNDAKASASCQVMLWGLHPSWMRSSQIPLMAIKGIHLAARLGLVEVVALLLGEREDPDCKDEDLRTPLSWAAQHGQKATVQLLLERDDVDADSKDMFGQTPLSWAAQNGHDVIVQIFITRNDINADSTDEGGRTPLGWAARYGHETIVQILSARDDVDADSKDEFNQTPLSYAAQNGYETIVQILVARNDVYTDSKDEFQQTPLSYAAQKGYEAIVKILITQNDVYADTKNNDSRTPLSLAAEEGYETVVRIFVARGDVNVNSKDKKGRTPLSWAARYGCETVVWILIALDDVNVNSKDRYGRTPLSLAAEEGHETVVRILIARDDINVDSKDRYGRTPLSVAAVAGHEAVVRILIARDDVDINSKDDKGRTPLSVAAGAGHEAVVRILIARDDVDINSKDDEGRTPLWWAEERGHEAIVRNLESKLKPQTRGERLCDELHE